MTSISGTNGKGNKPCNIVNKYIGMLNQELKAMSSIIETCIMFSWQMIRTKS